MYKQQRQYIFFKYLFNGIFFYDWRPVSLIPITDVSIKLPPPPYYLTIAIQQYIKIESYQFEHLLD